MLTKPPIPYDFCTSVPISCLLNGEGAFSIIVKTGCGTDGSFYSTNVKRVAQLDDILSKLSMENIKIELLFVFSPLAAIGLNCNP